MAVTLLVPVSIVIKHLYLQRFSLAAIFNAHLMPSVIANVLRITVFYFIVYCTVQYSSLTIA